VRQALYARRAGWSARSAAKGYAVGDQFVGEDDRPERRNG
jgi:hypothetical protein